MDMNDKFDSMPDPEEEIENIVDEVTEAADCKCFNFLINASNQANLVKTSSLSPAQINALFVIIHPYHLECFDLEDMNLSIKLSEDNIVSINGQKFETIELEPGIRVFGIAVNNGE